jgi:quercetin dioxygenase-like cupin family protein
VGEVPGIATTSISLAPGIAYREPGSRSEDRVYLVLAGAGEIIAGGAEYRVGRETIAHFPPGWDVEIKAGGPGGMGILVVRQTLTGQDRQELLAYDAVSRTAYLKAFDECAPYGEAIKSARTVSRTLLPGGIVPRMAIGTVEAAGPDRVAPHRHPMLEQYFLGLEHNAITVIADDVRTPLGAYELLHIPLGSNHGAEVAEGCRLRYVWIDFFHDRAGQEWLKQHTPLAPSSA